MKDANDLLPLDVLRDWIVSQRLDVDAKLPPERTLAKKLNITRSELRNALLVLEHDGVLTRHVGRGTYLSKQPGKSKPPNETPDILALAERTSPQDAMMARMSLEPELASLAAINATRGQLAAAETLAREMRQATNWAEYEALDARLHNLIAEASGNNLLHELHKILNNVRVFVVWGKLPMPHEGPPQDYHSFAEHDAIISALKNHDRAAAHEAMRTHLKAILGAMIFDEKPR